MSDNSLSNLPSRWEGPVSARLRTMKSKREWALWVRDETVADVIGKVAKEPNPVDQAVSIWLAAPLHVAGGCVNRIGAQ